MELNEFNNIGAVITILSAMITPAVLILASGSLSLTTSQRLSRSIDRTRKITNEFRDISSGRKVVSEDEKKMLIVQLFKAAKRAKLMQRAMTMLYIALCFFIATSLLIGIYDIMDWEHPWITVVIALTGAIVLLFAGIILIIESKLALSAVNNEMDFVLMSSHWDLNMEEKA
jgi:hypothetical protein